MLLEKKEIDCPSRPRALLDRRFVTFLSGQSTLPITCKM